MEDADAEHDQGEPVDEAPGGEGGKGGSVSFRRITAICYLRARGIPWEVSDGGALRLYPPAATPRANGCNGETAAAANGVVFKLSHRERGGGGESDGGNGGGTAVVVAASGVSTREGVVGDSNHSADVPGSRGDESGTDDRCGGDLNSDEDQAPVSGVAGGGEGEEGLGFVDVAPLAGRAVVFFSGAVEHEVLPVTGRVPRAALTTWFH